MLVVGCGKGSGAERSALAIAGKARSHRGDALLSDSRPSPLFRNRRQPPTPTANYFTRRSRIHPVPVTKAVQASLIQPIRAEASHSAKASISAL